MSKEVKTGDRLRDGRIAAGLSADQSADVYGEAVKGKPITRRAYLRMEEGYLPKDPKRRLVLAGMFGLVPALLVETDLLKIQPVPSLTNPVLRTTRKAPNLAEYRTALLSYWKQGHRGTAEETLRDLARRIRALHDNVLYVSSNEKAQMKQLLCGYHLRFAEIAREQHYEKLALDHFNDAIILAHEEAYHEFEAAALEQRGCFFLDTGNMKKAIQNFNAAAAINTPSQLRGTILMLQGLALMNVVRSDREKANVLHLVDQAEHKTSQTYEDVLYQASFPRFRYLRYRARVLMAAPTKQLRSPGQATEVLDELSNMGPSGLNGLVYKRIDLYRQLEMHMVQAQVWLDQGYEPVATTMAQACLDLMKRLDSYIHLPALTRIYESLRTSSYKSTDVARLGVDIIKVQYPHFFH